MSRRVMHEFDLHFISGVTRPAQKPAVAAIIKGDDMLTDAEKFAQIKKHLAVMAGLTAEEFTFFKGLSPTVQEAFLDASDGDRAAQVTKAEASDPVIHTASDGTKYRKSDGKAATLAKMLDEALRSAKAQESILKAQKFVTLAKTEFANLGEEKFVVALLEKVEELPDETKAGVTTLLKAQCENFNSATRALGTGGGGHDRAVNKNGKTAAEAYDAGVEKFAVDRKISKGQAYVEFASTKDGQELMKKYDDERNAAQ